MPSIDIQSLLRSTLLRLEKTGELSENDARDVVGLKISLVRTIAELEVAKLERVTARPTCVVDPSTIADVRFK
jgi:hypothetical protein